MGNGVLTVACVNLMVFQRGERKKHKQAYSCFLLPLLLNRLEPQSIKTKLLLPIILIGIVAQAFTL